MSDHKPTRITLIGVGTIGLSFAALHLLHNDNAEITIYDTRPDIENYVSSSLPNYLGESISSDTVSSLFSSRRLKIATHLAEAVKSSDIVQEQGPENVAFKQDTWCEIERHAPPNCLFWSSTSGISASVQSIGMTDASRLLVVHPYNPPHIMPLIEIVPSPFTALEVVVRTKTYWQSLGREPVVVQKEVKGFVANRLAFALLREAIHLVKEGVISVEDLDRVVQSSMGPRWAVAGPIKSYHMGGGSGGLKAFMENIGGTIQTVWDDLGHESVGEGWEEEVLRQTIEAYGEVKTSSLTKRDRMTREVLGVIGKLEVPEQQF